MKKIYLIGLAVLGIAMSVSAADFGGKKFYINPGHGGHDSNDRPTALPLSVPMFYESDGNLSRGLAARDFFTANKASVKMSRTTNTSGDDLALSTIASNSNSYGGYFMSLHSNAANASANYMVSFFRSSSSAKTTESIGGSKAMATQVSNWHDAVTLSNQTYATPRALGDYSFYGYNLGVLRTNNRPGYLVETWFHDYRPEALRMKSNTYNKFLAWQIVRAALASPGGSGTLPGVVMGDIRDLSLSCGYTNYTTRGRDKYKAVEGATVELLNSEGTVLQTMTTDNYENGFYAFWVSTAGTYTVRVSKSGYKTATKDVAISLNQQYMTNFDLTQGADTGISVTPAAIDLGELAIGSTASATITVSGASLSSAITATSSNSAFQLSASSLGTSGGSLTVTFTATASGTHSSTITLTSGSYTKTVNVTAVVTTPPLEFEEVWNFSETTGVNKSWTTDKTKMRNMCFGDGKLFVVDTETATITIVDAYSGEQTGTVNTEGVDGGAVKLMDVKYVDGKLLATNLATAGTSSSLPLKVYVWENGVDAAPSVLLSTSEIGHYHRIGHTFSIKGNLTNGAICYTARLSTNKNQICYYSITDGVVSTTPTILNVSTDGTAEGGLELGTSPRVVPDDDSDKYWVMGQNYYPSLVNADGILESTVNTEALKEIYQGNDFVEFAFNGAKYAFATTYLPAASSADGKTTLTGGRMILLDGSNGWASASNAGEYPAAGLGTTRNTSFSTSIAVNVVEGKRIDAWVLVHNQGIAYFTYDISATTAVNYPDIAPEGVALESSYSFSKEFESAEIAELTGKTIRRAIMRNGLFYVLAIDSSKVPYIYVIDPETKSVKTTVSTSGVAMTSVGGGTGVTGYTNSLQLPLSDIAFTADGYLLACNYSLVQDYEAKTAAADKGSFCVYKWGKDILSGLPVGYAQKIVDVQRNGFWDNAFVGYSFAVSGKLSDCSILTGGVTTSTSTQVRFVNVKVKGSTVTPTDIRVSPSPITGLEYQLNVSPLADGQFIFDNASLSPRDIVITADSNAKYDTWTTPNTMSSDITPSASYFKYSSNAIMATPTVNASGAVSGATWANISSTFASPKAISTGATITPAATASTYSTVGVNVVDNNMNMYLLADNKISKFVASLYTPVEPDPGVDVAIPDVFTTDWEYSAVKGNSCSFMDPSTDMTRNMVLKGDNLYILQRESSDCNIHIVDALTGTDKGNLPCTGITADNFKFFSVGNLGGTIVACSAALGEGSTLKVYAWDSDSATPTVVLETTNHGARAGDYMSCSGDINNGKLYFTNNDTSGNVYVYTVTNGKASATPTIITLKKADGTTAYGINDGVAVLDVRAQDDGTIICTGKGGMPTRFTAEGTYKEALTATALDNNTIGTCYYPFTYGQYTLAAAVTYTTGAKQGYLNLLNVTDGITKATKIHSYGALGKADVANGTFVTTAIAKPEGDGIHLWVLIPKQGIAKYSATTINSAVESIEALDSREILCTTTGFYATNARITVVNLSGVIVAEGYDHIDKASLAPGFYVVTATYADGMKLAKKVAVR